MQASLGKIAEAVENSDREKLEELDLTQPLKNEMVNGIKGVYYAEKQRRNRGFITFR